ncbi:Protein kinase [Cryptosporidium felis]|nr:Protein kinase [Cryptosporidium felis]
MASVLRESEGAEGVGPFGSGVTPPAAAPLGGGEVFRALEVEVDHSPSGSRDLLLLALDQLWRGVALLEGDDVFYVFGEDLPELHSVLVEAVDVQDEPLDGGSVLVEGEELSEVVGVANGEEEGDGGPVALEHLVGNQVFRAVLVVELPLGLSDGKGVRLGEEVAHQLIVAGNRLAQELEVVLGPREANELAVGGVDSLVEELEEAVLGVGAGLPEENGPRPDLVLQGLAVNAGALAVALHEELLDVGGELAEGLTVREHGHAVLVHEGGVVNSDEAQENREVLAYGGGLVVLVHLPAAVQEVLDQVRAEVDGERNEPHGAADRKPASHPVPEAEDVVHGDSEVGGGLDVGAHGGEVPAHRCLALEGLVEPLLDGFGVQNCLGRGEGFAHDDHQSSLGVESVRGSPDVYGVHVGQEAESPAAGALKPFRSRPQGLVHELRPEVAASDSDAYDVPEDLSRGPQEFALPDGVGELEDSAVHLGNDGPSFGGVDYASLELELDLLQQIRLRGQLDEELEALLVQVLSREVQQNPVESGRQTRVPHLVLDQVLQAGSGDCLIFSNEIGTAVWGKRGERKRLGIKGKRDGGRRNRARKTGNKELTRERADLAGAELFVLGPGLERLGRERTREEDDDNQGDSKELALPAGPEDVLDFGPGAGEAGERAVWLRVPREGEKNQVHRGSQGLEEEESGEERDGGSGKKGDRDSGSPKAREHPPVVRVVRGQEQDLAGNRDCPRGRAVRKALHGRTSEGPENILIGVDGQLKLADFGWSSHINNNKSRRRTFCGTYDYLPPEITRKQEYGPEVDIWSLGVLCYELVRGEPPFPSNQGHNVQYYLIQNKQPEYSPHWSPILVGFIHAALQKLPQNRITISDMLKHPFIVKYTCGEDPPKQLLASEDSSRAANCSDYSENNENMCKNS